MKMNYLLKPRQHKNPHLKPALIITAVFGVLVWLLFTFQSNFVFSLLGPVGKPIWKTRDAVSSFFSTRFSFLQEKSALINENQILNKRLADLSAISIQRDALVAENLSLKGLGHVLPEEEVAYVLASPIQSYYDVAVVELASNSMAEVGDNVFGPNGIVLGKIIERSGGIAKVEYFSSPDKKIIARIGKENTELELNGVGGGNFVTAIPRALEIASGDLVTIPAFNAGVVGVVGSVEVARSDSFKNVYISYPINIFELTWVKISHAK